MSIWQTGGNGQRCIEITGPQLRHELEIVERADNMWDVLLDARVIATFAATSRDEAEAGALGRLNTWLDEMHTAVFYLTTTKSWPLRPVHCTWCDYVGHNCGGERDGDEAYDDEEESGAAGRRSRYTQGDNVASSVWRGSGRTIKHRVDSDKGVEFRTLTFDTSTWYVQGHYGSSGFDADLFRFVKNPPTEPADPICDGCIQKRIDAGDLERIEGHFP